MELLSQPLVSVIVPVYNSETTLDACIRSVLDQSYAHLEIIVINDGSTDRSSDIIKKYAAGDGRVVAVDKPNEGVVKARQAGRKIARGKYIQYLDSDDTLRKDALLLLTDKAEKTQADMVSAPFFFCCGGKEKMGFWDFTEISGIDYIRKFLLSETPWSLWCRFHLRSLYSDDMEEPDLIYGEDVVLSLQLLFLSRKIVSIDYPIIDYNFTPASCSHPATFNDRKYRDLLFYCNWVDEYLVRKNLTKEVREELECFHITVDIARMRYKHDFRTVNGIMREMLKRIRLFPRIEDRLSKRFRKIVRVYRICGLLGYINIWRYCKQGKI